MNYVRHPDPFETLARQIDESEEEPGFEDDLLPLSHPSMQQAIAHYFEVVRAKNAPQSTQAISHD
jgi:hypothetical protein